MPIHLPPTLAHLRVYTRTELLADGCNDDYIRRGLRTGRIRALARGIFLVSPQDDLSVADKFLLRALARQARLGNGWGAARTAAAQLWGIADWHLPRSEIHLVHDGPRPTSQRFGDLIKQWAPLQPDDLSHQHGILVTSPARTVVDLACTLPFEPALVAMESALHLELATKPKLEIQLDRRRGARGIAKARQVVGFASTLSESPFESRSRVFFRRHGIPQPRQQFEVVDSAAGDVLGITDFHWEGTPVVGECDGMGKYFGDDYGDGARNYRRDKRKRETLEALGFVVISWTWDELDQQPARLAARIRTALESYGRRAA